MLISHGSTRTPAWPLFSYPLDKGLVVPEFARIPGPEKCYEAKTVVEAHNLCAGDPYFPFVSRHSERWTCILLFGMGRPFSGTFGRFDVIVYCEVLDATDFYGTQGHQVGPLFQVRKTWLGWASRDDFLSDRFALISWCYRIVILFKSACINGSFMIIWNHLLCFPGWKTSVRGRYFRNILTTNWMFFLPNRQPKVYSNIQSMFLHL